MTGPNDPGLFTQAPVRFRIRFGASESGLPDLLRMLENEYIPGLRAQRGFLSASVLVPFSSAVNAEIGATGLHTGCELEFDFESESRRRDWVAQPIHELLWGRAVGLTTSQEWSGFYIQEISASSEGGN